MISPLSSLLAGAIAPEPGRRYPRYMNVPQGIDIEGEIIPPSALPNPYGVRHIDPLERDFIRPQTTIDAYPWAS